MPIITQPLRDGYNLRLVVTGGTQSTAGNYTNVSWSLEIHRPSNQADYTGYATYWSVSIDGDTFSGSTPGYNFGNYSVLHLGSGTSRVHHDSDGTKTAYCFGTWRETDPNPQVGWSSNTTASENVSMKTIPRSSDPSFNKSSVDAGDAITIYTNRASSSFTHTLTYKFGSQTGTIATGVASSRSWTPPLSLLSQIPTSTSGTLTVTCKTYSGGSYVGTQSSSFTLKAPAEIKPDFATIGHDEAVATVSAQVGKYVKDLSKLALSIGGATGVYGSTIRTYKLTVAGQTINGASGTTAAPINQSGAVTVTGTVTDSRGRSISKQITVDVLDYEPPAIDAALFLLRRSNLAGTVQQDGTTIRIDFSAAVSSLVNGTEKNALTYKVYTRERGTTPWVLAANETPGALVATGPELVSAFAIDASWEVRLDVADLFATTAIAGTVATSKIFMHWDEGLGVGIGKFRENGALDVAGDIYGRADLFLEGGIHVDTDASILGALDVTGDATAERLRLRGQGDVSETSTDHAFQVGPDNGTNLVIDGNEIMARQNGVGKEVYFQYGISAPMLPFAMSAGYVGGATVPANGAIATTVTFPGGRFNVGPRMNVTSHGDARDTTVQVDSVTSNSFTLRRGSVSVANRSIGAHWIAVQMNSGSASG